LWFRVLSLIIGTALLVKATVALAAPGRFYEARRSQYASKAPLPQLLLAPIVVAALAASAWYATLFHYRSGGWIVTGFLTALTVMAVHHLVYWSDHRHTMFRVVSNPSIWLFDCFLLAVGTGFVGLAWLAF
jgi:hypothetical protein